MTARPASPKTPQLNIRDDALICDTFHQRGTTGKTTHNMKPVFNFCFKSFPWTLLMAGQQGGPNNKQNENIMKGSLDGATMRSSAQVMPQARSLHGSRLLPQTVTGDLSGSSVDGTGRIFNCLTVKGQSFHSAFTGLTCIETPYSTIKLCPSANAVVFK